MDDNPTKADPAIARDALGRMLTKEERVSDLIAFLAGLDPWPLLKALDLTARDPRVSREAMISGGRADLTVRDGDLPLALLEVKISAGEHGVQFNNYLSWANDQVPVVKCHLLCLDPHAQSAPEGWSTGISLSALFRFWQDSDHPHAGWLASSAAEVLEEWEAQFNGKIGRATYGVVANLVVRQLAVDFSKDVLERRPGLQWRAGRDSGPHAQFVAWLPYPIEPRVADAFICVDLRSEDDRQKRWALRLAVEVEVKDSTRTRQAKVVAHELAMAIRRSLTCTALQEALRRDGREYLAALASLVSPNPGSYDGVKGEPDDGILAAWQARVLDPENEKKKVPHPVFNYDNGLRLASIIRVEVVELDRHQLLALLEAALVHLNDSAAAATITLSETAERYRDAAMLSAAGDTISVLVTSTPDGASDLAGGPPDGPPE